MATRTVSYEGETITIDTSQALKTGAVQKTYSSTGPGEGTTRAHQNTAPGIATTQLFNIKGNAVKKNFVCPLLFPEESAPTQGAIVEVYGAAPGGVGQKPGKSVALANFSVEFIYTVIELEEKGYVTKAEAEEAWATEAVQFAVILFTVAPAAKEVLYIKVIG